MYVELGMIRRIPPYLVSMTEFNRGVVAMWAVFLLYLNTLSQTLKILWLS